MTMQVCAYARMYLDGGAREGERKEGRKERSLDFTRRHAHMQRAVCKCVQSDRGHFAARSLFLRAYPALSVASRVSLLLGSRVRRIPRVFSGRTRRDVQIYTAPRSPEED